MCAQAESESTSIAACIFDGNYIANAPSADSGNSAIGGALMLNSSFNGRIIDCSFIGNSATEGGAIGAWQQGASMPSEFRSNLFEDITVTFDCCDSYGNVGGSGNGEPATGDDCFSEDPAFCRADADSGLFTLWNHSPCASDNHPDEEECGLIGAEGLACWLFADCEATWLDEASPAMSHAGLDTFRVGVFPDSAIGLIHFHNISDEIPDTTVIIDAILTATAQGVVGVPAVDARTCLRPAAIGQATYYVYRTGAAWSYEGGADAGVDFGATTLGTTTGFTMYATDTLASGDALATWVEDVLDGDEYGILFVRPTSSATSGVAFRGCEEDSGPELRVYSPGGR